MLGGDWTGPAPCGAQVGRENLTDALASKYCISGDPDYKCWQETVVQKTGGLWFSTTKAGDCAGVPDGAQCTWRVKNISKIVNKTCSSNVRFDAVERLGSSRFENCSDSGVGPKRNTSSHCWLDAFYATVLGEGCGMPDCEVKGAPLAALVDAWRRPFLDETDGGCPALAAPVVARAPALRDREGGVI